MTARVAKCSTHFALRDRLDEVTTGSPWCEEAAKSVGSVLRKRVGHDFERLMGRFLTKIDEQVPEGLDIHLICDNYGTHKHPIIKTWLADHPRVQLHFTPTCSSRLNLVERFFGYVTADLLQRSDHGSVQALEAGDVRAWAAEAPKRLLCGIGHDHPEVSAPCVSPCSELAAMARLAPSRVCGRTCSTYRVSELGSWSGTIEPRSEHRRGNRTGRIQPVREGARCRNRWTS